MRLRPQSELGWQMLQWLAVLVLGHQAQANPALLRGVARTLAKRKAPAAEPSVGAAFTFRPGSIPPPVPERPPLWWVSFVSAADVFLGLVIVEAGSGASAIERALTLGINPGGQAMCLVIPDAERARCEPHRDRLLTEAEASALLDAKPIREWEESGEFKMIAAPEVIEQAPA